MRGHTEEKGPLKEVRGVQAEASQPLLTGSFPSQASPLSYIHCLSST